MSGDLGSYAGGGALALLLIREVFAFLKQQRHVHDASRIGDLDPAEWEKRLRMVIKEETDVIIEEIKTSRRLNHNIRDINRDIAKKLGVKVFYVDGGRERD